MDKMTVNGREYTVIRLLGKGKGGYSYLVTDGVTEYTLKQIHHEPCSYYQFGDKLESELRDYARLSEIGIPLPKLIEYDAENERILKEYIPGDTAAELIKRSGMNAGLIGQVRDMCRKLYEKNTNIDYYPTNFILNNGRLVYIDYECNEYSEQWDFEHLGEKYWTGEEPI